MLYFISDIHGHYNLFIKLLEKINFSSCDDMIILGDIIDKGPNSIKMIKFVRNQPNIKMILGNHEYYFLEKYHSLMKNFKESDDINNVLKELQNYFLDEMEVLDWEDIDFLDSLPYYIETNDYLCVHAGVEVDSNYNVVNLKKADTNYFLFDRNLKENIFNVKYNKTILFGHTPTVYQNQTGKFIKTKNTNITNSQKLKDYSKIQLDTGVYLTNMLGVLRYDDMKEIYVS